jgi:hypothetical protein
LPLASFSLSLRLTLLNPALSGTWKEEVLARVEIKTFSPILDFTNVET